MPKWIVPALILAAVISAVLLAFAVRDRNSKTTLTRYDPVPDMDHQRKFKTQTVHPQFADGRSMRPPAPGTMALADYHTDDHFHRGVTGGEWAATFPVAVDTTLMERGRERYDIYCATCHGITGDGNGITSVKALDLEEGTWIPPTSYHSDRIRDMAHGQIFNTITYGVRNMAPYGPQIPAADRWAIIAYLRALQRAQNSTLDDVPEDKKEMFRQ